MITLTDERGLIFSPKSWAEIEEIPGYVKGIDPKKHKLKAIIGSYHLKDVHCGLSCNSPHDKGYIAQTQSGAVTNIGHICGKNYFGVDFTTFANQHNREVTAKSHRDLLSTFSLQLDDLENEVSQLRHSEFGLDWIYKTSKELINRGGGCPDEVVKAVRVMVKSRSIVLKKERAANEDEIKAYALANAKPLKYVEETMANIYGLEVLFEENDLKKLVIDDVLENIKLFKNLTIDDLIYSELIRWAKWVSSLEGVKEKIQNSMSAGLSLLTQTNLEPFTKIISKSEDSKLFAKFLKKLPSASS
ncbi:MAG: hypothetical protein HOP06_07280 [Methylotenera sp.]|nr:hypothetical protein [Methylotenera sp.]